MSSLLSSKKNIFLTGGQGFIGQHLQRYLTQRGHFVHSLVGKLEDKSSLLQQLSESPSHHKHWDAIIHLAGLSSPAICESHPEQAFADNTQATAQLLSSITQVSSCHKAHLIFSSTAHVYDQPLNGELIDETTPIKIKNVYGESKLQAENLFKAHSQSTQQLTTVLRLFNHGHISQSPDFLIASLYQQIKNLEPNQNTVLVGNLDLYRDFGSIPDLLLAFTALIEKQADRENFEVFNICAGRALYLKDLAQQIAASLNRKDIQFVVDPKRLRANESKVIVGSCQKMNRIYGWRPTHTEIENFILPLS